jgi:hypothetical protein
VKTVQGQTVPQILAASAVRAVEGAIEQMAVVSLSLTPEERLQTATEAAGALFATLEVDSLRAVRALLDGVIQARTGEPLDVWDGREGRLRDTPPGGALLCVEWAVSDHSYTRWYPTLDGAKAALLLLADKEGRGVTDNEMKVDLTSPGCVESRAYVVARS